MDLETSKKLIPIAESWLLKRRLDIITLLYKLLNRAQVFIQVLDSKIFKKLRFILDFPPSS